MITTLVGTVAVICLVIGLVYLFVIEPRSKVHDL